MPFDKITHFILGLSVVCILLTLVAIGAQAGEDGLPQPDPVINASAVTTLAPGEDLITRQLHAIKTRDADLAWSMTTGDFHKKFDDGKDFLSHLRLELRPIYNHEDYTFLDHSQNGNVMMQKVEMEDRYGTPVTVLYRLEKQQDGQWLIDSFTVLEAEAEPI